MKINVNEELGIKKPIEVRATNLNMERSLQMQLDLAKAGDIAEGEDVDVIATLQQSLDIVRKMTQFIKNILKLSDVQSEKVDDLNQEETAMLVNRLCLRIMGNSDEEIKELFTEPTSEAEKK